MEPTLQEDSKTFFAKFQKKEILTVNGFVVKPISAIEIIGEFSKFLGMDIGVRIFDESGFIKYGLLARPDCLDKFCIGGSSNKLKELYELVCRVNGI